MTDTKTEYRARDLTTEDKTYYRSNHGRPPAQEPEPEPKPKRIDLSPTQLAGGALAAMTSAVVGARLGVAGTVLGAAVGSVVAGVAGTLYTTSLRHTKEKISEVIVAKAGDAETEIIPVSVEPDRMADQHASNQVTVGDTRTLQLSLAADPAVQPAAAADATQPGQPGRRWPWKAILMSTAAVFVLTFAAITGFEVLTGHAISGGQGTTITQVSEGRSSGSSKPSDAPSTQPSDSASTEASTETSSAPSAEPSQSAAPSSTPSATTVPPATTTETPSAGAGAGDQGGVRGQADSTDGTIADR